MEKIIEILMKRDELDYETAKTLVQETLDEILTHPEDAEEIMADYLGLEPDYIDDLILP